MFLLKREYFNKTFIIKGLYSAILFSAFIYLSYFGFEYKILHTILALMALYLILSIPRISLFYCGFFVGIFWFYWISFSFIYYDLFYLIPFIIFGFAFVYGLFFLSMSIIDNIYFRAFIFILLSYFSPFGFNWFKPEIIFINSFFDVSKLSFILLILATIFLIKEKRIIYFALLLFTFFVGLYAQNKDTSLLESDLKIAMPTFDVKQDFKWDRKNSSLIVRQNLNHINEAIKNGYDIVVLPETAFPLVLNKDDMLMNLLKHKSKEINIITGALYKEGTQYNNSTYLFSNSQVNIAHKVVLVPFGEEIPLPEVMRDFINDIFYDGAQDYNKANKPTDFLIEATKFRNAICYEATHEKIYENLNGVKYIIAMSNNAWFMPSIEPVLQKLLMKYYAKKHNVIIYHVANGSENFILHP